MTRRRPWYAGPDEGDPQRKERAVSDQGHIPATLDDYRAITPINSRCFIPRHLAERVERLHPNAMILDDHNLSAPNELLAYLLHLGLDAYEREQAAAQDRQP